MYGTRTFCKRCCASVAFLLIILQCSIDSANASSHLRRMNNFQRNFGSGGESIAQRHISTRSRRVQRRLVMLHDLFRTRVRPPAANMLSMRWHPGAARNAQRWADACVFLQHDAAEERAVPRFDQCGQNIFVSTQKVPWLFAMRSWYVEHLNFTYGSPYNNPSVVGHYTQMVWATTHKVGCAVTKCARGGPRNKPFYNYVCNYCPAGNYPQQLAVPYKAGAPCSSCRSSCKSHKVRLCTNACNVANTYSNCDQLYSRSPDWLCGKNSGSGARRNNAVTTNSLAVYGGSQRDKCLATCSCQGKIYD